MIAALISAGVALILFAATFLAPSKDVAYVAFSVGVALIIVAPLFHPRLIRNAPVITVSRRWRVLAKAADDAQQPPPIGAAPSITLAPSGGPSRQLRLSVTNEGPPARLSASCRIVARRNDPNPLRVGVFSLPWLHGNSPEREIQTGGSENLVIATVETYEWRAYGELRIRELVYGASAVFESSRWDRAPEVALPEYDIEVRIVARGFQQPVIETFTVRPENWTGGVRMAAT